MIASNSSSMCEQARPYYYDYLWGESRESIPTGILAHISQCRFCQAEVDRLKIVLAEAEERAAESSGQATAVITTNLRLHFAYTGALVTCNTVRPFLPSLADPALAVRIPTPITVHLDKCQQCADDLEAIRQLNLTHKQLCRLGQLFAEKPPEDATSCLQARAAILAVVTMVFRETNREVLKHLCTCPDCRGQLYQYRETVRKEFLHNRRAQQKFPCESVSATDIFDYCFPYGIDPANDQYAKFRSAFTLHASACPECLGKMQGLHRTVCSILERREFGIVTRFKVLEDSVRDAIVTSPDDLYEDWPIEVEVLDKSEPEPNTIAFTQGPKQRISATNLRRFKIPAVAAIILIAVGLFLFSTPVAKAVDLSQVYKALERIRNVCITTFAAGESKPAQEVWISRALNIKMFKSEMECVLWDIKAKSKTARDLNTGSITKTELDKDALAKTQQAIHGPVGLLPFDDISEVPPDAVWQQVADENIEFAVPDTEVYDLVWMEKRLGGSIVYKKWRTYIDVRTSLPKRVEWCRKPAKGAEYELLTVAEVAYPAADEIRAVISGAGF